MASRLDARLARLRYYCALKLPDYYQSIQADIEALLKEYDRLRPRDGQKDLACR